ncbi:MAG: hypothetical protein KAS07_05915, partial [Candidatus Pacebacteria bacterium]|nr:hypothetical protein [Candidatus Paceibacterota bacterium]
MNTLYEEFEEYDVEEVAARFSCFVVYRKSNQLQIDIDSVDAMDIYVRRRRELLALGWVFTEDINPSKSRGCRKHITLTFAKSIGEWKAVGLQLMLGSDPMRENMNALR